MCLTSLCTRVPGAKVVETEAVAGGGSLPGLSIPSCGVAVEAARPAGLATRLRAARIVASSLSNNGTKP